MWPAHPEAPQQVVLLTGLKVCLIEDDRTVLLATHALLDNFKYRDKWWVLDIGGNNLRLLAFMSKRFSISPALFFH